MLTPEYLRDMPEEIIELFARAEQEILADMARRISKYDFWIPAAEWQKQKLMEAGRTQEEILRALTSLTGKTQRELQRLMQDAARKTVNSDLALYDSIGLDTAKKNSEALQKILTAGYRATAQTMVNLTRTTARTASMQFEHVLDRAWMKVQSGAFDYNKAISDAVSELAEKGLASIRYPSGHTDYLDVSVRRAVVTGVNQTCCRIQMELADEVGCDLVEVSAHPGARPEHAVWQGKIFRINKKPLDK